MPLPVIPVLIRLVPVFLSAVLRAAGPVAAKLLDKKSDKEYVRTLERGAMSQRDVVEKEQQTMRSFERYNRLEIIRTNARLMVQMSPKEASRLFWALTSELCSITLKLLHESPIELESEKKSRYNICNYERDIGNMQDYHSSILEQDDEMCSLYFKIMQILRIKNNVIVQFARPRYSSTMTLEEQLLENSYLVNALSELQIISDKKIDRLD